MQISKAVNRAQDQDFFLSFVCIQGIPQIHVVDNADEVSTSPPAAEKTAAVIVRNKEDPEDLLSQATGAQVPETAGVVHNADEVSTSPTATEKTAAVIVSPAVRTARKRESRENGGIPVPTERVCTREPDAFEVMEEGAKKVLLLELLVGEEKAGHVFRTQGRIMSKDIRINKIPAIFQEIESNATYIEEFLSTAAMEKIESKRLKALDDPDAWKCGGVWK